MELTELEQDLLGDLAQDDHALYEIFAFVRHHHPDFEDGGVFAAGRALVDCWIQRRWLVLAGDGAMWGAARSIDDVVPLLDRLGVEATQYFLGAPWLRLAPKAYSDVEWLGPAA